MNRQGLVLIVALAMMASIVGLTVLPKGNAKESPKEETTTQAEKAPEASPAEAAATQKEKDRKQRADLRAFYTAPPVIPHSPSLLRNNDCLICHREIREIGDRTSLLTPHTHMTSCTQCHVSQKAVFGEKAVPVETTWEGLKQPEEGDRAHVVAPPTMPHRATLREACLTCHAADSPYVSLRCPHPERVSCQQCHVSEGDQEFKLKKSEDE